MTNDADLKHAALIFRILPGIYLQMQTWVALDVDNIQHFNTVSRNQIIDMVHPAALAA
jgi:hypothetical protein